MQDKIDELKKKFPEDAALIDAKVRSAKRAELLMDLRDHAGMQMLEAELVRNITAINHKLLNEPVLTEKEREVLMAKRDCWEWFVNQFPNAQKSLDSLESEFKKHL